MKHSSSNPSPSHPSPSHPSPAAPVTPRPVPAGERLRVTADGRFLARADGSPFFYLGDTAWELLHRLTREEADLYLRTRAEQGYTVIQAVALAELDGLRTPNAYGDLPLHDLDPTRPNEAYFAHVDWVVRRAAELGMHTGLLPTWGDKWCDTVTWSGPIVIFNTENARVYGEFLGRRYRDLPIIWILGGDRPVDTDGQRLILRAMAEGLAAGDGGCHLRTLHPRGGATSAQFVHDEPWLDFNMLQSGHATRDIANANYPMIERDYARVPAKPCMDSEPRYEDHPIMTPDWSSADGYFDEADVRHAAYWALFAGAHGHTYGCHGVWQMLDPAKHEGVNRARTPWQKAILLPGARQMIHARRLLESRPCFVRVPDQALISGDAGSAGRHMQATRASDGSYGFVYTPVRQTMTVDLRRLAGPNLAAAWFDPRTGESHDIGQYAADQVHEFTPPAEGPDWVLTLDSVGR